jgi:tRNA modification GTPase
LTGRVPPPRRATLAAVADPVTGSPLDRALVLWFPAPRSFTGEDVAELHLHGGRAVVDGVLEALSGVPGLRPAEAGEFSRRAFANGKIDLTAAEGLADLVAAETEAQRRQALRQLDGALGRLYEGWRERLVHALAGVEAALDFADEPLPEDLIERARPEAAAVGEEIRLHLDDGRRGERLREGLSVAIVGPPNAGKSSLINRLAERDVAIVDELAGTTRDVIEVHLDLNGVPVTVADTAGIRGGGDRAEAEGVRRAHARAGAADMVLAVFDATTLPELDPATLALLREDSLVVLNKTDLVARPIPGCIGGWPTVAVSCLSGEGLGALVDRVAATVGEVGGEGPPLTRARHRAALAACAQALADFARAEAPELAAEDLRHAVRALGRITGRVDVEDVLDSIFSEFCIGK